MSSPSSRLRRCLRSRRNARRQGDPCQPHGLRRSDPPPRLWRIATLPITSRAARSTSSPSAFSARRFKRANTSVATLTILQPLPLKFHFDVLPAALAVLGVAGPALGGDPQSCIERHEEGLAAEESGALLAASKNYEQCAGAQCPEVIRDECAGRLTAVGLATPTIVIGGATSDGPDVTKGRYQIDGTGDEHELDGRPIAVDPGSHVIMVTSPMGVGRAEILVRQGEKNRVVTITVVNDDGEASAAEPWIHPAAWISGSVGLAGLGVFAIFGGLGLAQESVVDECRPSCTIADVDRMRDLYLVGDVGLLTGLVGLGAAGVLGFMLAPDTEVEATGTGLRLRMRF